MMKSQLHGRSYDSEHHSIVVWGLRIGALPKVLPARIFLEYLKPGQDRGLMAEHLINSRRRLADTSQV